MKKILSIVAAALAVSCFGQGSSKLATRQWTRQFVSEQLAEYGVKVSTADVVSSVSETGTAQTNIVVETGMRTNVVETVEAVTNVTDVSHYVTNIVDVSEVVTNYTPRTVAVTNVSDVYVIVTNTVDNVTNVVAVAVPATNIYEATETDIAISTNSWTQTNMVFMAQAVTSVVENISVVTNVYEESSAVTNVTSAFPSRTVTVQSPFECATMPSCASVAFTFDISTRDRSSVAVRSSPLDFLFLRAFAAAGGGKSLTMTLKSFTWTDRDGNPHYVELSGRIFDSGEVLPAKPSDKHVCRLDAHCNCTMKDNTISSVEVPDDYSFDPDAQGNRLSDWQDNWYLWVDLDSWPKSDIIGRGAGAVYKLYDDNNGVFYLHDAVKSDAWKQGVREAWRDACKWYDDCAANYIMSRICDQVNPQHRRETRSCGSFSWTVCSRCGASISGSERHDFANGNAGAAGHYCKCPESRMEAHSMVPAAEPTTVSGGWRADLVCSVPGCGYVQEGEVHTCHHVNCKPCDAGDNCELPCSCEGNHVEKEMVAGETCAACQCEGSESCDWHPDAIAKHTGWEPCGEDAEDDNDDDTARGGHCRCQCHTFGHNARTEHDYKAGPMVYLPYNKDPENYHLERQKSCSRCGQHFGKKQPHVYSGENDRWQFKSDAVCIWIQPCDKCSREKKTDQAHVSNGDEVYIDFSETICRRVETCKNCKAPYKTDGPHLFEGSEKEFVSASPGKITYHQKCGNGCGRVKIVVEDCEHPAWKYLRTEVPAVGWLQDVYQCELCGQERKDPSRECTHSGGLTRTGVKSETATTITYTIKCGTCGFTGEETIPKSMMGTCDTANDVHIPKGGECGCLCGEYGSGKAHSGEGFHQWASASVCMCKCGNYHRGIKPTTYDLNLTAPSECANICKGCHTRRHDANGLNAAGASSSDHTPCTVSHHRCGCCCGKYDANDVVNVERFHVQMPGDCRCYGADGHGGTWHFPMESSSSCPNICTGTWGGYFDGDKHVKTLTATRTSPHRAQPSDHTEKSTMSCGCKCGELGSSNYQTWSGIERFHKWDSANGHCICVCGHSPTHKPIANSLCTKICDGYAQDHSRGCTGLYSGKEPDGELKHCHTPKDSGCGCKCGEYHDYDYNDRTKEDARFHPAGQDCLCTCGRYHRFESGNSCTRICNGCKHYLGTGWLGSENVGVATWKSHTPKKTNCGCECGDPTSPIDNAKDGVANRPEFHNWGEEPNSRCMCLCGDKHKEHWNVYTTSRKSNPEESWTCESCNEEFVKWLEFTWCRREICYLPNHLISSNVVWKGEHAENCGSEDPEHPDYVSGDYCPGCGCKCQEEGENHGRDVCPGCGSKCPECTDGEPVEEETTQTTDNPAESGGGSGGGGGIIVITR